MLRIILLALVIIVPHVSIAEPLTKPELFTLYVQTVSPSTAATRMQQLYDALPAGAVKDQAKNLLIGDLVGALDAQAATLQSLADELASKSTDVGDTDL